MRCKKCDGTGIYYEEYDGVEMQCPECKGTGEVDNNG